MRWIFAQERRRRHIMMRCIRQRWPSLPDFARRMFIGGTPQYDRKARMPLHILYSPRDNINLRCLGGRKDALKRSFMSGRIRHVAHPPPHDILAYFISAFLHIRGILFRR